MSIEYLTGSMPSQGKVTPLIDGFEYFDDFFLNIENLKAGDKLYLMNWHIEFWFYKKSNVNDNNRTRPLDDFLLTKLQQLVSNGVDVKILIWVNTNLFDPLYPITPEGEHESVDAGQLSLLLNDVSISGPHKGYMAKNLDTVHVWRNNNISGLHNTVLKNKIIINTLDALTGGCHSKFALFLKKNSVGEYVGKCYTGGIDLQGDRYSKWPHVGFYNVADKIIFGNNFWHDVMIKIEGINIVESLFHFYQELWNENLDRKTNYNPTIKHKFNANDVYIPCIPDNAEEIESVLFELSNDPNEHLIQSLRTIPDIYPIFGEPEISFAEEGKFEIRKSVRHAFERAEKYIYVEDQAMNSLELFGFIKNALNRNPQLRVVLITGGDPGDEPITIDKVLVNQFHFSEFTEEQRLRFHFYKANYTIHSKIFLVDDKVAIVGSAGFITRSLSQELEHSIAFIDNNGTNTIKEFREKLWTEHTGIDIKNVHPTLDQALSIWDNEFFGNTDPSSNATGLIKIRLEQNTFTDISEFWSGIPILIAKSILNNEHLTPDEQAKLDAYHAYKDELLSATKHLITWEIPFFSWFNPSQSPNVTGIQFIDKDRVAINEKARLELISSQISIVSWEYTQNDGTPLNGVGDEFEIQFSNPGIKTVLAVQTFVPNNMIMRYSYLINVLENSGPQWVARFPDTKAIEDLSEPFRKRISEFIDAIEEAGLTYEIFSTLRPFERAYLMAYACKISNGLDPSKVKLRLENVNISWVHYKANGKMDINASKQAAQAMVEAYNIGETGAVYPSNHSEGVAIDLGITITSPIQIRNKAGRLVRVSNQSQLKNVARTYGIRRLKLSNHWSITDN